MSSDPEKTRKERNKIACRKSRQKKSKQFQDLDQRTKTLEEEHNKLIEQLKRAVNSHNEPVEISRRFSVIHDVLSAIENCNHFPSMSHFTRDCITLKQQCTDATGPEGFFDAWTELHNMFASPKFEATNVEALDPNGDQMCVRWNFRGIVTENTLEEFELNMKETHHIRGKEMSISGESLFIFHYYHLVFVNHSWGRHSIETALDNLI